MRRFSSSTGFLWVLLLSSSLCTVYSLSYPYITETDKGRLKDVFLQGIKQKDLGAIHYSVLGYNLLQAPIPNGPELCQILSNSLGEKSAENYYYISSAWTAAKCPGTLPVATISEGLSRELKRTDKQLTTATLYYSVLGLKAVGKGNTLDTKAIKADLTEILKKDDSVSSLAFGLHVAAELGAELAGFLHTRIEDVVIQADEIDGKYLQFEGGLSITALVVSGAYKLSTVVNKPPPISEDQALKFGNYFVSRKSVQTAKGAWSLLNVLQILTTNKFQKPIAVSLDSFVSNKLTVRVTDLMGQSLGSPISVNLDSLAKVNSGSAVATKISFEQVQVAPTYYSVKLPPNVEPGVYKATVSVTSANSVLVGGAKNILDVKVTGTLTVPDPFLLGVVDSDNFLEPKYEKVSYPSKLGRVIQLDSHQRLSMKFGFKEKTTKQAAPVHQAFIRLSHVETVQEVIFVAELDSQNNFHLVLDIGAKAAEFGHLSGSYHVELIAGDSIYSNSIRWVVATIEVSFPGEAKAKTPQQSLHSLKPEIKHVFREPEKRPPVFVSNLFTGLVLLPLLILFILWIRLGINISNFSLRLSVLGFHLGLGAIFCLFGLFWLRLNMFETLKYLLAVGLVTFVSGNKLLASIAAKHKS